MYICFVIHVSNSRDYDSRFSNKCEACRQKSGQGVVLYWQIMAHNRGSLLCLTCRLLIELLCITSIIMGKDDPQIIVDDLEFFLIEEPKI